MATREYRASAFGFVYLVLILVIFGGYWTEFKELVFPSPAEPEAKYSSVIVTRATPRPKSAPEKTAANLPLTGRLPPVQTAQMDLPPQPQPQANQPEADAPRQSSEPSDHAPPSDIAISRQAAADESDQGTQKEGPAQDAAEEPRRSALTEATNWQSLSDLLRLAVQAQEAGRASEARPLLECIVALSKDTPTGDEAAQRLRQLTHEEKKQRDLAERQLVADVLRRATEEQAAGRLVEARRLLQWVATISQGTPSAEEAAGRLRDLEQTQRAQREQAAAAILREATALQEKGQATEAQRLYRDILSLYQDTSATAVVRQHRAVAVEDPAALALDAALALREAGDPAEAYRQLRTLASRYPGSRPAEEARRLMRLMETGDPQTVSEFLRQAADAQTAGRLFEARRLWEWVGAMYPRSAAADEAHRRLQQLTKLEQAGREQVVTEALQQTITLEEKGDLEGALQVLAGIRTQSRDTSAYEAVRRRQRQLEDALAKRDSARQLQEAADLEKRGLLQAARARLEDLVRKYPDTPAASEAVRRLSRWAPEQPH